MKYHKVRLGDLDHIKKEHPVIAAQGAGFAIPALPPSSEDDMDFPVLFYGEEDGELACYMRSFPDAVRIEGRDIPVGWAGNLMTLPAFRRRGLAQAITEQQYTAFEHSGHVWMGVFSAPAALRLYEKLSFTMVGMAPRLCFVRNVSPFLAHHMPGLAARALGLGGTAISTGLDRILRFRQPWRKAVTLTPINTETFTDIISDAEKSTPDIVRFDRSASWVLRRRDVRDIDQIMLVHHKDAPEPIGYFLVRQRQNEKRPIREKYYGVTSMTVMHFGLLRAHPDGYEMLLSAALNHFFASKADLFEIVSSQDAMVAASQRAGLIPLGEGMSFKFMEPSSLKGVLPVALNAYHLTHYAGDAFAFE